MVLSIVLFEWNSALDVFDTSICFERQRSVLLFCSILLSDCHPLFYISTIND